MQAIAIQKKIEKARGGLIMSEKPTYKELQQRVQQLEQASFEHKRQNKALKKTRDQFEAVLTNIQCITCRCALDKEWTMEYMSPHLDQLTGYPPSDFINSTVRPYESIIHPEDSDYVFQTVLKAIESGTSWEFENRIRHRDGGIRWLYEKRQCRDKS